MNIDIGRNCNNRCLMCIYPKSIGPEPPIKNIKKLIDKNMDDKDFYITGGEPTLRRDLFEIVEYIHKVSPKSEIKLITNGRMMFYKKYVKKITKSSIFKIITEIHGSETIHDRITQVKGSFRQTLNGIKNSLNYNINVEVRIILHKLNYKEIPKIFEIFEKEIPTINNVVIFPADITGNAKKKIDILSVKYNEMINIINIIIEKYSDKFNIKIYHIPPCLFQEKQYKFLKNLSTNPKRITFTNKCEHCKLKYNCSGIWKTYIEEYGDDEFGKIQS
ncbi:MAG: radical SAM protein [Nanoarchaeota archaeon]|nr:radical SAM protein [Nanoarchaeota archaeon]